MAGAAIGGGIMGAVVAANQGIAAKLEAKKDYERSKKLMKYQMQFQKMMSDTAFQRAADDLEAAGLNRILALGQPASSPAGGQAAWRSQFPEGVNRGIANGIQVARAFQELKTSRAQEASLAASAGKALVDAEGRRIQNAKDIVGIPKAKVRERVETDFWKGAGNLYQTLKGAATSAYEQWLKPNKGVDRTSPDWQRNNPYADPDYFDVERELQTNPQNWR